MLRTGVSDMEAIRTELNETKENGEQRNKAVDRQMLISPSMIVLPGRCSQCKRYMILLHKVVMIWNFIYNVRIGDEIERVSRTCREKVISFDIR